MEPGHNLDMSNTNNTEPLSTVEGLEPEPGSESSLAGRRARLLEMVLGLLLLVGVLGYAGWQWWRTEISRSHYEQGKQEAVARHWDEALSQFEQAGGYLDADRLAANAQKQIDKRDSQYSIAQSGISAGTSRAIETLDAARAVEAIEPGYRDVDTLAAKAEALVYDDALHGTIVLRNASGADPAGLYYRRDGAWQRLEGSDGYSGVLSTDIGGRGCVVYDAPSPGWNPPPDLDLNQARPGGTAQKVGRLLKVARFDESGALQSAQLKFIPTQDEYYMCASDAQGTTVWGLQSGPGGLYVPLISGEYPLTVNPLQYERVEGEKSSPVEQVHFAGPIGYSAVVALGASGGSVVFATAQNPDLGANSPKIISVSKADGSDPRSVFTTTGSLISVQLSPSERYLLVTTVEPVPTDIGPDGYHPVAMSRLFDLQTGAPPATVMHTTAGMRVFQGDNPGILHESYVVGSTFLRYGALRDKLLVGDLPDGEGGFVRVRLLDPARPDVALAQVGLTGTGSNPSVMLTEQADGRSVLLYGNQSDQPGQAGATSSLDLEVIQLPAGADGPPEIRAAAIPLPAELSSQPALPGHFELSLRGDRLVYTAFSSEGRAPLAVYSAPWSNADGPTGPLTQAVSTTWSKEGTVTWWQAGHNSFVYKDQEGTLFAASYSGSGTVQIGGGIAPLANLQGGYSVSALR